MKMIVKFVASGKPWKDAYAPSPFKLKEPNMKDAIYQLRTTTKEGAMRQRQFEARRVLNGNLNRFFFFMTHIGMLSLSSPEICPLKKKV